MGMMCVVDGLIISAFVLIEFQILVFFFNFEAVPIGPTIREGFYHEEHYT